MADNPKKFDFRILLQVLVMLLLLVNIIFLVNFFKDKDVTLQIKSKTQTGSDLLGIGAQNSLNSSGIGGNNPSLVKENEDIKDVATVQVPGNGAGQGSSVQEYRKFEVTPEIEQKILGIAETNETVRDQNFNSVGMRRIIFLPMERISAEKESNGLYQMLPEGKDFFQVNYANEVGNYTAVIDLNEEKLLFFYRISEVVIN